MARLCICIASFIIHRLFINVVYLEQYDIVCVCETWLNELILDNQILPRYTIHRKDRCSNVRGGGVLVALKNELRSSRRPLLEGQQSEHLMVELYPALYLMIELYRNSDRSCMLCFEKSGN